MKSIPIGQLLVEGGFITEAQLEIALKKQRDELTNPEGLKTGDMLLKLGFVSEAQLVHALSTRLKVPFVDITTVDVDINAVKKIPEAIAKKHVCIAFKMDSGRLFVATNDPINFFIFDDLTVTTGMEIIPMLATKSTILDAIARTYSQSNVSRVVDDLNREFAAEKIIEKIDDLSDDNEKIGNAPVVKLVNSLIETAYKRNISDIHIEPYHDRIRIRMRLDGDLIEQMSLKPAVHAALITRLKILGGMNIAEKRVPLDGRYGMKIDDTDLDVRLSSIPTVYGEKMVIRLMSGADDRSRSITDLGMTDYNYDMFKSIIRSPHGIMLVTGPTGSGKSTTLYATLRELSRPNVNIVTVEDPVEKKIDGVNQVQINSKAGMTFAAALRSILRQDPDVIMVGEIRDNETADIAVRAAITGHLVLSTLHTNDAASTILRLVDMGVAPYMVASSLIGVIAQRLVKLLCPNCKEKHLTSNPADLRLLGINEPATIWRHHIGGCKDCSFMGYKGRTAIHETIVSSIDIKEIIAREGTAEQIEQKAIENGTKLLRQNVADMVLAGITTMEELVRATYSV